MLSDVEAKSQYIYAYMDILQIYYGYTCNITQLYCINEYIYYIVGHEFLKNNVLCLKKMDD